MIWAMILAAGESKRMGKPKLLLPFGDKTIIEIVVGIVVSSKIEKTLVILGSDREKIEKKIKNFPVEVVYNRDWRGGMLSSVQRGFKALAGDARGVLIVLGDQPKISTTVINKLIDAHKNSGKGIVLPVYKGERGHPVLLDVKYGGEVENLSPETGLRGTVYNHPEDILEVEVESPSILQDIDDMSYYKRELGNKG
jgi:molybdenum cofactor cytidylyltransferase